MKLATTIFCRPTSWFLTRMLLVTALFGGFCVYFFYDASIGYPQKNATFFLYKTFEDAGKQFVEKKLSDVEWAAYAAQQVCALPEDKSLLPASVQPGFAWPAILHDATQLRDKNWNAIWNDFSASWGEWSMSNVPPEHSYNEGQIREQWIGGVICGLIALVALVLLIRSRGKNLQWNGEAVINSDGVTVPVKDWTRLDLRKWKNKGVAFVDYATASGKGRFKIDGFLYGGFRADDEHSAENLLNAAREKFSGELVDYEEVVTVENDEK